MPRRDIAPWRRQSELIPSFEERWPVRRALESMFEDFFHGFPREGLMSGMFETTGRPRIDMEETDDSYRIHAEMPGIDQKDIDVTVTGNILTIRGERKVEKTEESEGQPICRECQYGVYERSISLPMEVEVDNINANYRNGVLHVEMPKSQQAKEKVRKIELH
ncbi:MAG: Hsp20/alpha crystallin family protein [Syntrophotaleaceae bacterium]